MNSPCLYEQDASHEGINVLLATPQLCVYERVSRHGADRMLILVNLGEKTSDPLCLRLGRNRRYHQVCGVGELALPAELWTDTASQSLTLSLPARTGAVYSLAC